MRLRISTKLNKSFQVSGDDSLYLNPSEWADRSDIFVMEYPDDHAEHLREALESEIADGSVVVEMD